MRCGRFLACALLLAAASAAPAAGAPKDLTADQLDALHLAQGRGTRGQIDRKAADEIAAVLARIRAQVPVVAGIHARGEAALDSVLMQLKQPLTGPIDDSMRRTPITTTGIASIDAVAAGLGVADCRTIGGQTLQIRFQEPKDMPTLVALFAGLPEIEFAAPDALIGDGDQIFLMPRGDRWHVVFKRGLGDCPAGCTENHFYYVTFDRKADTATLVEEKHPVPRGAPEKPRTTFIYRWGVPRRRAIRREDFPTLAELHAKLVHADWWVALHAVDALGFLLTETGNNHLGEDHDDLIGELRARALADRPRSIAALVDALAHADPDVSSTAHASLKKLSGLTLGREPADVPRWREWAKKQR